MKKISDTTKRQFRIINKTPRTYYSHWDIEGLLDAQLDSCEEEIKEEYPIMYKEEAEFVGWLIDKGWIPPEQYRINIERLEKEHKEKVREREEASKRYIRDTNTMYHIGVEAGRKQEKAGIVTELEELNAHEIVEGHPVLEFVAGWQALKQEVNDGS